MACRYTNNKKIINYHMLGTGVLHIFTFFVLCEYMWLSFYCTYFIGWCGPAKHLYWSLIQCNKCESDRATCSMILAVIGGTGKDLNALFVELRSQHSCVGMNQISGLPHLKSWCLLKWEHTKYPYWFDCNPSVEVGFDWSAFSYECSSLPGLTSRGLWKSLIIDWLVSCRFILLCSFSPRGDDWQPS